MNNFEAPEGEELLRARIENAKKALEEAEANLAEAKSGEDKIIWENRVKQRREELINLRETLEEKAA